MDKPVNHLVTAAFILVAITGVVLTAAAKLDTSKPPMATDVAASASQEAMIRKNYLLNTLLRPNQLEVKVAEGHATLAGRVDRAADREMAEKIALAVEGIVTVDNRIVVESDYLPTQPYKPTRQGAPTDDVNISAAIVAKLQWSDYRKALDVQVSTHAGKVTLQGTAETLEAKLFADKTANSTAGVVAVSNQLNVKSSAAEVLSQLWQRTDGSRRALVDGWITTKVRTQLLYSGLSTRGDIVVRTRSGVVSLSGSVPSDQTHAQVIELAQNTQGVRLVLANNLAR